jgi:hypothetical protein
LQELLHCAGKTLGGQKQRTMISAFQRGVLSAGEYPGQLLGTVVKKCFAPAPDQANALIQKTAKMAQRMGVGFLYMWFLGRFLTSSVRASVKHYFGNRAVGLRKPSSIEHTAVRVSYLAIAATLTMKLMSQDFPRRYKARYASSMADEINENVVLAPGEVICYSQLVRERKSWLIAQPRLLAITQFRIILLEHSLVGADWILEIPRSAVEHVSHKESFLNAWVDFTYSDGGETRTVQIQPMRRGPPDEAANRELFDTLNAFHVGQSNPPG